MRVTFTKKARRYDVYISRDRATDLFATSAPGYDDLLPHDVFHFVAEAEFGVDEGIFGSMAALKKVRIPDGRRSEQLVSRLEQQWRTGTAPPELQATLDALAEQWHALPVGGSPTLEWPIVER